MDNRHIHHNHRVHHLDSPGVIITSNSYHLQSSSTGVMPYSQSAGFEVRLFYVRISPCVVGSVPDHLTLRHPRREVGASIDVNCVRIPASETTSLVLRRDRIDRESSEVTYVSTETVRITGCVDFEVFDNEGMILCGNLDRIEGEWNNGTVSDQNTGWGMDCYMAMCNGSGSCSTAFFQPKLGVSSPSAEVYIAGRCGGVPVILTKTIQASPRRKVARHVTLDAIPEDEEVGKNQDVSGPIRNRKTRESEVESYECDMKFGDRECYNYYREEDGQVSWFNAGVRVGVGISLGMCVGVGIGVGLLMHSYQTTARKLGRKFL